MCGIAGWVETQPMPAEGRVVKQVQQALRHRGPDATQWTKVHGATLIHTRLSIIDLSPAGVQPMANEDGTVWVIFNGEIYNHRKLRRELEKRGHRFRGKSDTEVLPHLYEEEGTQFLDRLRGMFALAIYDTKSRTLLLARDRFGIKPLFYAPTPERLAFASEINPLLCVPEIETQPNQQAISDFAAFLFIPAPQSFYRGIYALEPGEYLLASLDTNRIHWRTHRFYNWVISPNYQMSLDEAVEKADALIKSGVQRQLESDVPLGALLSGGIDSSLVCSAAQAEPNGQLHTFNVRFSDQSFDETWAAQKVAERIGSIHKTLDMDSVPGSWDFLTGLLNKTGQPFADTSLFAVNAVCRLMRKYVTVVLSGDGGDEGFGGYQLYWYLIRIARFQRLPEKLVTGMALMLNFLARKHKFLRSIAQRSQLIAEYDDVSVVAGLFRWIRAAEHRRLVRCGDVLPPRRFFEPQWEHRVHGRISRIDRLFALATEANTRFILPNDFLFKVDFASMRESIEVRVPMLDESLFEFGLQLPHHFKVKNGTCKRILRTVAEKKLPRSVAGKPKAGFSVPVDRWVDTKLLQQLKEALLSPSSRLPDFFSPSVYQPWVEAFTSRRGLPGMSRQGLYQRVMMLLAVHLFLEKG